MFPRRHAVSHVNVSVRRVVHVWLQNRGGAVSIILPTRRVTPVNMEEKLHST